jgi:hypothetical protein
MTLYQTFEGASRVFFPLQNAWHHDVASEFPDRRGRDRRDPAVHTMDASWPPIVGHFRYSSGDCRIFAPLGKLLLYPLEQRFPPGDAARGAPDGIVVLGGAIDPDLSAAKGGAVFLRAADRIVAAAALARQYPNARVVFSGGNANLISNSSATEADYALSAFERLGVPQARLTMERGSRNTLENAEFSKAIANPKLRRAVAIGDLRLPHATSDRTVPQGGICR